MFGFSSIPYVEGHAMRRTTDSIWVVICSIAAVFILAYVHIPA
jgi:hypothetical protein